MLRFGYTGTQRGMTSPQYMTLRRTMQMFVDLGEETEGHHGDCIGGDLQFDTLCRELGVPRCIHPPENEAKRAFCERLHPSSVSVVYEPLAYLVRNKNVVLSSTVMLAGPGERGEVLRSGTWSTIRYARGRRPLYIVYPDGKWSASGLAGPQFLPLLPEDSSEYPF